MDNLDDALDKMVDYLLSYEEIEFLDLVQYVWRRGWPMASAQIPNDTDPLRRALKASLIERMVEIWSSPPKNSPEQAPEWCASIPPTPERFSVISPEDEALWIEEPPCPVFEKRNIFAPKEFMFFL